MNSSYSIFRERISLVLTDLGEVCRSQTALVVNMWSLFQIYLKSDYLRFREACPLDR